LRRTPSAILAGLRKKVDELKATLEEVRSESETAVQARNTALSALDARVTEVQAAVDQQVSRLDTALAQQTSNFDTAQESRRQEFDSTVKHFREELGNALTETKAVAHEAVEKFDAEAKERLKALTDHQARAEEVVGIIARTGMAGGYEQFANREARTADRFRWMTIGLGIAVVGVLVWGANIAANGNLTPEGATVKLALSAALGGLAAYTARQSHHHRTTAERARNIQLALASIGPYLAQLDEERRAAIIEAFAFLFFSPPNQAPTSEPGPGTTQALLDFIAKASPQK